MFPFAAVVPMDVGQTGSVSARVEERFRRGSDIKATETEFNPILKYDVIWRGGQNHFVMLYQPRFIYTHSYDRRFPDPNLVNLGTLNLRNPNDTPLSVLHNGGVGFEAIRPRWRLSLYQFAAYGTISTTALLVQAPWGGDAPPPDPNPIIPSTIGSRFTLLFAQTQLFVPIRLSPRTALIPGVVYNAFGGADQESRGVIAFTYGPGANLTLDHAASKTDRFISVIGAGEIQTRFQDDRDNVIIYRAEANQTWRHWWTPNVSTDLMGGGTIGGDAINGFTIYSLGAASILYDSWPLVRIAPGAAPMGGPEGRGTRLQLGLVAKIAPWIDLFSGDLEQRLVVAGAMNYGVDRVTFRTYVGGARVMNTPRSVAQYQILLTEAGLRFNLTPTFAADGGLRVGFQDFNNAVRFNQLTQATFFAGLTYAPLPARF
jgi:hypothetical protein